MDKKTKRLTEKEYHFIYKRTPRLCIDLLLKTQKGFLLSKRLIPPFKGWWHFPGGRVLHKEAINRAISRIAFSELGLKVKEASLVGYGEAFNEKRFIHSVALIFEVKSVEGKLQGSKQAQELKFFKKAPKNIIPAHSGFLKRTGKFQSTGKLTLS